MKILLSLQMANRNLQPLNERYDHESMNITKTSVVKSVAGHDKGKLYCVVYCEKGFAFLVNGKTKKLVNPKRKSIKHLEVLPTKAINMEDFQSDKRIRRLLREIAEESV